MNKISIFQFLFQANPNAMNLDNYKGIAQKKGWKTKLAGYLSQQTERDILTFDTFSILAILAKDQLSFGGGTLLNWIELRDSPRFSFDVDTQLQYGAHTKEEVMAKVVGPINDSLRKSGKVTTVEIDGKKFEIGLIYFDKEKDHFPYMLSLKRCVHALTIGRDAHEYIRKELGGLTDKQVLALKKMYGGQFCKIEDVRIEIGFSEKGEPKFPTREIDVEPLVNPEAKLSPVRANVTVREHTIASKIFRLGKQYSDSELPFQISDFIKALSDLRNWETSDIQDTLKYIRQICGSEDYDAKQVLEGARSLLTWLSSHPKAQEWFERGPQTSMLATKITYVELISNAIELINKIKKT